MTKGIESFFVEPAVIFYKKVNSFSWLSGLMKKSYGRRPSVKLEFPAFCIGESFIVRVYA